MRQLKNTRVIWILRVVMPLVSVGSVWLFAPWEAAWLWMSPLLDTVQEEIDRAIAYELEGIIVYVDSPQAGQMLYAAGLQNRAAQTPANPESLFKIASISKLYIAAAAAKLVEVGDISLDDTLAEHLPELVGRIENSDVISLRMMLQHRSGIPDFLDAPDYPWGETLPDRNAYLEFALDKPAEFEPNSDYRYSNTNYLLIGDILDKALGYSHHRYIADEILVPLGLRDTYSLLEQVDEGAVVSSGYHHNNEDDFLTSDYIAPGGSMVASAEDVGIFLRALKEGIVLSEEEQAIYESIYVYEHTGWVVGYQSFARYDEETGTVIVLFVNTTGGDAELTARVVLNRVARLSVR